VIVWFIHFTRVLATHASTGRTALHIASVAFAVLKIEAKNSKYEYAIVSFLFV